MPALLRILSREEHNDTLETRLVYLNTICEIGLSVTAAEEGAEIPEEENDVPESQDNIDSSDTSEYENVMLKYRRNDGSEEELDLKEKTYNFQVLDEDGEEMCATDDPFEIETGLLIAAMDTSHKRTKAAEKFAKEQKEKKEAAAKEAEEAKKTDSKEPAASMEKVVG